MMSFFAQRTVQLKRVEEHERRLASAEMERFFQRAEALVCCGRRRSGSHYLFSACFSLFRNLNSELGSGLDDYSHDHSRI